MTRRQPMKPEDLAFGVEVECGGPSRGALASAIADALARDVVEGSPDHGVAPRQPGANLATIRAGINVIGHSSVRDAQGRLWNLVGDASISGLGLGTEIVTPKLCGDRDLATLQIVVRAAKAAGAAVNESCGVHVHVDGAPIKRDPTSIVRLAHSWARYEDLVGLAIDLLPRRRQNYCKPVEAEFLRRLDVAERDAKNARRDLSIVDVTRAWYGHLPDRGEVDHYHGSRYHALNLHALLGDPRKCTVEFRAFNGTLHAGKIRAYVQLVRCVVAHALNAHHVKRGRRDYDPTWTRYALFGLLKNLGMSGDLYATAREHLISLGKGAAGFKTAASYHAWKVRHGRVAVTPSGEFVGPVPPGDVDAGRCESPSVDGAPCGYCAGCREDREDASDNAAQAEEQPQPSAPVVVREGSCAVCGALAGPHIVLVAGVDGAPRCAWCAGLRMQPGPAYGPIHDDDEAMRAFAMADDVDDSAAP